MSWSQVLIDALKTLKKNKSSKRKNISKKEIYSGKQNEMKEIDGII